MKSIKLIHIVLILLGIVIGLFGEYEAVTELSWERAIMTGPIAMAFVILTLGVFFTLSNASSIHYLFWFTYLSAILSVSVGIGLVAQSIYSREVVPDYFSVLFGGIGFLLGLYVVIKIQKWRHGNAF